MALVAAATIDAELSDISSFSKAEQLMSYLELVPSEDSSRKRRRQGGITKAGNGAARRMLVEAENRRLKKLLAESMLNVSALNDLLGKN